jgi:hypothetical protein
LPSITYNPSHMDLNFVTDPELAPRPREEMAITSFKATPYPDGRRIRLDIVTTPFVPADRPNLDVVALDADGEPVGSVSVIETANYKLSLTMHLRVPEPTGEYTFKVMLFYDSQEVQDTALDRITLPEDIPTEG